MRKIATAIALTGTMLITACATAGIEETRPPESTVEATTSFDIGTIESLSIQSKNTCHTETKFKGKPLASSEFKPNDFNAAYIEEGGRYIRYVTVGTVDMSQGNGTVTPVGYMCAYLQREKVDSPASSDNLGIVIEDDVMTSATEIEAIEGLRDYLRDFHGDDDRIVYEGDYSEVSDGWADSLVVESSSPAVSTGRASVPVSRIDSVYAETVRGYGVDISDQQFAEVSAPVCDSYESGGGLDAAISTVAGITGHVGWEATRVVQGVVVSKCSEFAELTY